MPTERIQRQIDALLDQVEQAAAGLDWGRVRSLCDGVLRLDPENQDARAFLDAASRDTGVAGQTRAPGAEPQKPPQPASFVNGRYTVTKFLGEGGKKKVFLAHDTTLDRDVAFALIKSEGLDDTSRQRITREAQAMGRLGDHPNIVPIFDLGQELDPATGVSQPFMVLPLMGGGDVEGVIEKAPDHRVPLDRVLQIAKDTCEGLVFAHSRGIIHRDLKPGNVWLTREGRARIGDFGLAVATDRSRLTREGMMVGTVSYMPPEQAMGGDITPRADLYSLGAMLYEMVTGRPPFLADDDIAVIGQHINTPPVAPTWHRPDCPRPLDALIMRLLAKDPAQRPDSATDVLSALSAIDLSGTGTTGVSHGASVQASQAGDQGPRSLDAMSSGVFVGRHREMDQLRAALEDALSGHGRMVTLVGEPGIGKTRTAQELATYAGLRRAQVLWGRCYEGGGAPAYWPWVQVLRQYVREHEPDRIRREMGSSASVIAEIVPDVAERLPGLARVTDLDSPESTRFRLSDSIASFLRTASNAQPLVVLLDDLHWADRPTLLLLEFVAGELANSRILLVGTYRDVDLSRRHPLAVTLGDLTKERLFERVLLRGLAREDVGKFIQLAAGSDPPPGLTDAVFTQTEGNPLFVTEVVRLLVQEGQLTDDRTTRKTGRTTSWIVRVPEGVSEVIGRRLDRLSDRCNQVLTMASAIGRQFSMGQLMAVLNDPGAAAEDRVSEDRLLEMVEEALAARVIEEIPSEVGRYQFTHALIQDTLVNELSTTRRVRLHARIAAALERLYGTDAASHAEELVHHFAEAEAVAGTGKLVEYSLKAGQQALAALAFDAALEHFGRGLEAIGAAEKGPDWAMLTLGLGQARAALFQRAERQKAVEVLRSAVDYFVANGDSEAAIQAATTQLVPVSRGGGHGTDICGMIEQVLPLTPAGSLARAELLMRYGAALAIEKADDAAASAAIKECGDIVHQLRDPRVEVAFRRYALTVPMQGGRLEGVDKQAGEAADAAAAAGDAFTEARLRYYQVLAAINAGETTEAKTAHARLFELAMSLKDINITEQTLGVGCGLNAMTGDWDVARGFQRRLSQLSGEEDDSQRGLGAFIDLSTGKRSDLSWAGAGPAEAVFEVAAGVKVERGAPRLAEAMSMFEGMLADPSLSQSYKRTAALSLGLLAANVAEPDLARAAYDRLLPLGHVVESWGPAACSERVLGQLAAVMRERPAAARHFEDALAFNRRAGAGPELARTCLDFADLLRDGGTEAELDRAAGLLDESLAIAQRLGMTPLVEKIVARKKILKA